MGMPNESGRNKTAIPVVSAIAVILIVLFSSAVFAFQSITRDAIHDVGASYIEELAGTLNSRIQAKSDQSCNEMLLIVEPLDEAFEIGFYTEHLDSADYLSRQCLNCDMSYLALISRDGMGYGSDGQAFKLADAESISQWLSRGRTFITSEDIHNMSLPLDEMLFYYFVRIAPFEADGQTIVAMIGGLDSDVAAMVLGNDIGISDTSIVTANGNFLFFPEGYASMAKGGNLFDLLDEYASFNHGGSVADIKAAIGNRESFQASVVLDGVEENLYLRPLDGTDLYICIAMPTSASDFAMTELSDALVGTAILIIVCVIVAAFLFSYLYSRSLRSSRELLAEEKERAELASEEARKASMAKSDFLSRMSHEIRTPLSGVIGMTEVALRNVGDDTKTVDSLKKIDLSSKHLLSLINDILDMSKIEQGKMEITNAPFDLKALIETIGVVTEEQAAQKNIHFRTIMEHNVGDCYIGDQLHLSQVLYNLLSNSLKFTPEGGFIVLHISKIGNGFEDRHPSRSGLPLDGAQLEAASEGTTQDWLRFVVSDTGCGIDEDFMRIIFDPFEQEHANSAQKYGGTGLGLAITKRFSEMMGGDIEVSSTLGKGAVFTLTLPFIPDTCDSVLDDKERNGFAAAATIAKEPLVDSVGKGGVYDFSPYRILLVEDNELNREIAVELIGLTHAAIEPAENGAVAVRKFEESEPGYYDLILMDIQMPVLDGYGATRAIRAMDRPDASTVPIIAMTANAFQEDVDHCIDAGMNDHISKPLDTRIMFAKMDRIFHHDFV